MKSGGGSGAFLLALLVVAGALQVTIHAASTPANNVAIQWNKLGTTLTCSNPGFRVFGTGLILPHLHLAQWHALLALKGTGDCSTEEAVVAYASHRVLSEYFPFMKDISIDTLLTDQINALGWSKSQQKLGKRLGAAVALEVLEKKYVREYGLKELKDELTARIATHTPGLFSYHNNTLAGQQAQEFITYINSRAFVVPDPVEYIEDYLHEIRPPRVPSDAWDAQYKELINIGRADWPGRTKEMNNTAAIYGCYIDGHCSLEDLSFKVARIVLPSETSLYDTVVLFAKIAVACYDATVVNINVQWGYSFWRPFLAFRNGDPRHAPIPTWTPFSDNPFHPEYPSGTACVISAGITTLQNFFGNKVVSFSLDHGTVLPGCLVPAGTHIGVRHYSALHKIVREAQNGRMYAGGHWNISVIDGIKVGAKVANYVEKHWGRSKTSPYGVLPNSIYLNVVAKQPKKAGDFSPITMSY